MKFLHTSDWHIGQRFYRYDRDEEHERFFAVLADVMRREQPDALLVSGDIYDTAAPSAQSQRLLVQALTGLHVACPSARIIVTAGNHDSGSRIDALRRLWAAVGVDVVGGCVRNSDGLCDPAQFLIEIVGRGVVAAVPFFGHRAYPAVVSDLSRDDRQKAFFQAVLDEANALGGGLPVVMMAHLTVSGCNLADQDLQAIGGVEADDIASLGHGYDYLALGHIHKPQYVGRMGRARYCGSPFAMSFAEDYSHFVDIVEIDAHGYAPRVSHVPIEPLRGVVTVPAGGAPLEEALAAFAALPDDCADYVRVLVDEDGLLPADADDRANAVAKGKACRYCEIKKVVKAGALGRLDRGEALEIDEIRALQPLDIAAEAYGRMRGAEMPDSLRALMAEVIAMDDINAARED